MGIIYDKWYSNLNLKHLCCRKFATYATNHPVEIGIVNKADHYLTNSYTDCSGIKGVMDVETLERPMSLGGYVISY